MQASAGVKSANAHLNGDLDLLRSRPEIGAFAEKTRVNSVFTLTRNTENENITNILS